MLFSIDHGNSAIKTPNFVFTSGLADYPVRPPVEADILEYGGTFWTLSGQRISYMRDKTADDRFFVLTAVCACQGTPAHRRSFPYDRRRPCGWPAA